MESSLDPCPLHLCEPLIDAFFILEIEYFSGISSSWALRLYRCSLSTTTLEGWTLHIIPAIILLWTDWVPVSRCIIGFKALRIAQGWSLSCGTKNPFLDRYQRLLVVLFSLKLYIGIRNELLYLFFTHRMCCLFSHTLSIVQRTKRKLAPTSTIVSEVLTGLLFLLGDPLRCIARFLRAFVTRGFQMLLVVLYKFCIQSHFRSKLAVNLLADNLANRWGTLNLCHAWLNLLFRYDLRWKMSPFVVRVEIIPWTYLPIWRWW